MEEKNEVQEVIDYVDKTERKKLTKQILRIINLMEDNAFEDFAVKLICRYKTAI